MCLGLAERNMHLQLLPTNSSQAVWQPGLGRIPGSRHHQCNPSTDCNLFSHARQQADCDAHPILTAAPER